MLEKAVTLSDFISQVKEELEVSIKKGESDPFFILKDVELEVSFTMEGKAGGKANLVVVDINGEVKAHKTHKVKVTLTPFVTNPNSSGGIKTKAVNPSAGNRPSNTPDINEKGNKGISRAIVASNKKPDFKTGRGKQGTTKAKR